MTSTISLSDLDITSGRVYQREGYPWRAWDLLRREAPVYWYEHKGFEPFWAITKHEDILAISKRPDLFISSKRLVLADVPSVEEPPRPEDLALQQRHILNMDPPMHGIYRNLVSRRFTPRGLAPLEPAVEAMSRGVIEDVSARLVDEISGVGHCDFVGDLAAKLPVFVITEMCGVPQQDAELMFRWTNEAIGAGDQEYQQGRSAAETGRQAAMQLFGYFANLLAQRRQDPKDDLITLLLNARVDGAPIADMEILSYCFLLIIAGNETTRNATSGGMLALLEHPGELQKLRDDASLADSAVEEILRWVSPVVHFLRTATKETEIRGQSIRAGESVCMFYPSANRDEDVFEDPYRFDITRSPNEHLAFGGYGEHFCLGANLARLELRTIFRELFERLPDIELDGPVERLHSTLVGGIKHMPVRFTPAR
jgi:cytochrome P450